jgi:signal transduction histidine kinase
MYAAAQRNANISALERMVADRTKTLEKTNARLEEANRRVTMASAAQLEHFACMSHEIRTPLNCSIGLSSLLLDSDLGPMQEESVRMIVTSGDLLLTVVNDILDYAKLESGNVEIVPTRTNLQYTLNAVVQSIETKALPKQLTIRTVFDPLIGEFAHMDHRRLQQILFNLLGNAVKFSHDGGTITLSLSLLQGVVPKQLIETNQSAEVFRSNSIVVHERPSDVDSPVRSSFTITSSQASSFIRV